MLRLQGLMVLGMLLFGLCSHATLRAERSFLEAVPQAEAMVVVEVVKKEVVWAKTLFVRAGISINQVGPDRLLTVVYARNLLSVGRERVRFVLLGGEKGDFGQRVSGAGNVELGEKYVVLLGRAGPGGIRKVQGQGLGLLHLRDGNVWPVLNGKSVLRDGVSAEIIPFKILQEAVKPYFAVFSSICLQSISVKNTANFKCMHEEITSREDASLRTQRNP